MKKGFFCLFLLAFMSYSCSDKMDELTVRLALNGKLTVKLADAAGKPIMGTKIKLYDDGVVIDERQTDEIGKAEFGEVSGGTYTVSVDTVRVDSIMYKPSRSVQVATGAEKTVLINPQDYVGSAKFFFCDYDYYTGYYDCQGLRVLLIPTASVVGDSIPEETDAFVAYLEAKAEYAGVTNANGSVLFNKVPSGISYYVVYFQKDKYEPGSVDVIQLDKDETFVEYYTLGSYYYDYMSQIKKKK